VQLPAGIPAAIQFAKTSRAWVGTAAYGEGGIGCALLAGLIRNEARSPSVCDGWSGEGARSAWSEFSTTGAPFVGGEPWHAVQ
jgi:hypothetical protein